MTQRQHTQEEVDKHTRHLETATVPDPFNGDWFRYARLTEDDKRAPLPGEHGYRGVVDAVRAVRDYNRPAVTLRGPRLGDVERHVRETDKVNRERRRRWRTGEGRDVQEVDQRGVRPELLAPAPTKQEEADLEEIAPGVLDEYYYSRNGRPAGDTISTNWVTNTVFRARLEQTDGPSIELGKVRARRFVTDERSIITGMLTQSGAVSIGGEYALFSYRLRPQDKNIWATDDSRILISTRATTVNGIERAIDANNMFLLDMKYVMPVLDSPDFVPVELPIENMAIAKRRDPDPAHKSAVHVATVRRPFAQYTFIRDADTGKWMLTEVDWWIMRNFFFGRNATEETRFLHWRISWRVNGTEENLDRFVIDAVEDPTSDPLDPLLYINIYPNPDRVPRAKSAEFVIRDGQAYSVRVGVTRSSVAFQRDRRGDRKPLFGAASADLVPVRLVPQADLDAVQTETILLGAGGATSEIKLKQRNNKEDALMVVAPSMTVPGAQQLVNLRLGPVLRSEVDRALVTSRPMRFPGKA